MTKLKSFDELTQLRDKIKNENDLLQADSNSIKVLVSMATCGIAAGAKDTRDAILDEAAKLGLKDITVTACGCLGMCYCEPTVEIITAKESTLYGNVGPKEARLIVAKHLKSGEIVKKLIIEKSY